jgi:CHAT domain
MLSQDHTNILQILHEAGAGDPLSALSREDLVKRTGLSEERIRQATGYLERQQLIVVRSRHLGIRIFHSYYITPEGIDSLETAARSSPPPPPPPPPQPEIVALTLRIAPQGKRAQISWEAHEIGHHSSKFRPPYDAATLPLVIKALDAVQYPGHPNQGPRFDQAEREQLTRLGLWKDERVAANIDRLVGRVLYDRLLADDEAKIALSGARNAAIANGRTLAYLLRFPPEAIELAALPWELLRDKANPVLLSQGLLSSFVRYLDLDQALPPLLPAGSSLRILAISPNARIPAAVRAEERAARTAAWGALIQAGVVTLEELNPAVPKALVDRIQNGPPVDIIHFYGHGRYKDGEGALLFDTDAGGEDWVSAGRLAAQLGKARLVMLHACQSAMIGAEGLLTGVAPALSAAGVPAVVAMQLTVRIDAATRFAGIAYRALAQGDSVQFAVSQARQALYTEASDGASWYVPTLTIRARDTGPLHLVVRSS